MSCQSLTVLCIAHIAALSQNPGFLKQVALYSKAYVDVCILCKLRASCSSNCWVTASCAPVLGHIFLCGKQQALRVTSRCTAIDTKEYDCWFVVVAPAPLGLSMLLTCHVSQQHRVRPVGLTVCILSAVFAGMQEAVFGVLQDL